MLLHDRQRALALYVLCLGVLMIVLDTTIVAVALPSIIAELRIDGSSLTWLVNSYTVAFGGLLLLGGRLGDLYGPRRIFLAGIALFTLASCGCGLAHTSTEIIAGRALQGLGGALVTAVSLSLIMRLFPILSERVVAMSVYGFVCAAGGAVGEVVGGFLTGLLGWNWIFLVNVPLGFAVYGLCTGILPRDRSNDRQSTSLDAAGAILVTAAMVAALCALLSGGGTGWMSTKVMGLLGACGILLLLFLMTEARVSHPLVPLHLFKSRNLAIAAIIGVLWSAGAYAWFVVCALYLQKVLGFDPLQVGLAFLPSTLLIGLFSIGLSGKLVTRFGLRPPLCSGMLLVALGLAVFACAPIDGSFAVNVLPGMVLQGLGSGMAATPLLLVAMDKVRSSDTGVASGIINAVLMMGGALGLALLASLADMRTAALAKTGLGFVSALNGGYHVAFIAGAVLTATAALLGIFALRIPAPGAGYQTADCA